MDLDLAAIDPIWLAVAAGVVLLIVVAIVVAMMRKRRRREKFADRYGPEYERTVEKAGSRRAADKELQDREERRQEFDLRPLAQDEQDRFRARWEDLQASFVDGPADAVRRADELIDDVASQVGYPQAGRDQRLADLSVDHAEAVDHYRQGRPRSQDADRPPTTEQLRTALLSSRSLFEAIVGRDEDGVASPEAPFTELDHDDRRNGQPQTGTGAEADRDVSPPQEVDVREHEPATSTTSPVLGPDGRPLETDDR